MTYKEIYSQTIWQVIELLANHKTLIESEDIQGMEQTKSKLTALKVTLNQIYCDASNLYMAEKREVATKQDKLYFEYRKTMTQGDSERKAKIDTDFTLLDELKSQRMKTGKMIKDVEQVLIDLAIILRSKRNEATYG